MNKHKPPLVGHKWYTSLHDKNEVSPLSKILSCISVCFNKAKEDGYKAYILLKRMQIRVEQNIGGLLEREKDAVCEKKQTHKRGIKSKLEGWSKGGQEWIYFNSFSKPPTLRRGRVRKRTSYYYGKENWAVFISNGSDTPQKFGEVRQPDRKLGVTGKLVKTFRTRVEGGTV